ncbi:MULTISPECIES: SusC/RagA family TonB-linked outer membrane protein [Hymenobacter]|uniref:TonB-dependent receptor n=1 Tax=Hymenobacter jejuensis TaxID=2502781 RepID=A0A5B8A3L0_9BACT|nr:MULTISPECIES: TonB-dependent receptor [Hymenobacter]MBC6989648.1 TonB-dependent receptor [Hymenobacter sp. BT491]QDA61709.1 TonB-dependent receptor [Hymenobacter jejuensis]
MNRIRLFLMLLASVIALTAQGQTRQVTGRVFSGTDKSPLPGVSVVLKGTTTATATDNDGKFTLAVPASGDGVLVFSSIGYDATEARLGSGSTVDVTLKEKTTALNDVVVVGYGTQRKRDVTGSVASVTAEQVAETPIARADQILQGRVSGVQVTQTNSEPGGNVSIRIRGTNSINSGNEPLFVVDGFPGAGDLNSINPSDIESIEVLKDASATAIYGSRGANGVVIITTKKGKAGKNTISFEAYTGISNVRKKYDLMNAPQFASYLNDVQTLNNLENKTTTALPYTQQQIAAMDKGTDWQDAIFRQGRMSNYQLGFNGGNEDTRYNLSFNYFDQQGIILNSGFQRGSVRLNLDKKVSNKINVTFSSQISRTLQKITSVNTNGGSNGGVVLDALRFSPIQPVKDANGDYTFQNQPLPAVEIAGNPVAYAKGSRDNLTTLRGLLNLAGEYQIIEGLKLRIAAGADLFNNQRNQYIPSTVYVGQNTNGSATKASVNNYSWLNENTLTYDRKLNENNALNVVAGLTFQQFVNENYSASANNFFTNALGSDNIGIGANVLTPVSGKNANTLASYFGRVNYRLFERYLFTFTMRADGSSRFGPNNKWGYFPSAAFAYRVIDEPFMQGITSISDLKLRASYGITGNQEIGSYQSLGRYGLNAYTSGTTRLVGLSASNIPNPDLSWESTAASDFGVDIAFLKNRISVTADYYFKKTKDLLLQVSVPQTSGFSNILQNAGSVQNKGFEFSLNTVNFDSKKFSWNTNLNFSLNRNKVLDLNGEFQRFVGQSSTSIFPGATGATSVLRVGEPIGSFFGYQFLGIWQTPEEITASGITNVVRPGDPRYADLNGDKKIDANDRTIIGRAQPKFIYGITNGFNFGPVGLNIFIQGVQGSDVLNLNRYELESGFTTTNKLATVVNRWTGPGTSNTIPKANSVVRRNTGITSDIVENGSFVRLKTATISFKLPLPETVTGTVKSASIYVTGQNLITITKYSGYDPEVNSFGNSGLSLNTDYNAFPSTRTFIAGVKIGF